MSSTSEHKLTIRNQHNRRNDATQVRWRPVGA